MNTETSAPAPRTVLVITKSEPQKAGRWDSLEKISKALAALAIPLVLGIGGWAIQRSLQDQTVARDYTQLAVTLLREGSATAVDPDIRTWAAKLLAQKSPIAMDSTVV